MTRITIPDSLYPQRDGLDLEFYQNARDSLLWIDARESDIESIQLCLNATAAQDLVDFLQLYIAYRSDVDDDPVEEDN